MWMLMTLASAAPGMEGSFFKTASAALVAFVTAVAARESFVSWAWLVTATTGINAAIVRDFLRNEECMAVFIVEFEIVQKPSSSGGVKQG
jgi:hypothetical protein